VVAENVVCVALTALLVVPPLSMAVFTPSEFSPPLGIPISTTTTRLESEATRPGATATTTRAFGPASSLAGSQSKPTISRPVSVAYCEEVQVAWSGGESPYSLAVSSALILCLVSGVHIS